jgi:hypothetical protein
MSNEPVKKARIFNAALPAANTNFLGSDIVPVFDPSILRIYFCPSITGVFAVKRTNKGVTVTELLNGGVALTAGAGYIFDVPWVAGDSINIQLSTPPLGGSNLADGTGTATGAPITLAMGVNTIVVTGAGNFTVTLGAGITGIAASGTATVVGSPQALVAGANVVDTGITTGDFTITLNGGNINLLQIDEMWED